MSNKPNYKIVSPKRDFVYKHICPKCFHIYCCFSNAYDKSLKLPHGRGNGMDWISLGSEYKCYNFVDWINSITNKKEGI